MRVVLIVRHWQAEIQLDRCLGHTAVTHPLGDGKGQFHKILVGAVPVFDLGLHRHISEGVCV